MATASFSATVNTTGPLTYTVPVGKIAVFAGFPVVQGANSINIFINSVQVGAASASTEVVKPLSANAGDVVSVTGTGSLGLNGLLKDA